MLVLGWYVLEDSEHGNDVKRKTITEIRGEGTWYQVIVPHLHRLLEPRVNADSLPNESVELSEKDPVRASDVQDACPS